MHRLFILPWLLLVAQASADELRMTPQDYWTLRFSCVAPKNLDGKLTARTTISQPQPFQQTMTSKVQVSGGRATWDVVYPLIDEGRFNVKPGTWDGQWEMGEYRFKAELRSDQKVVARLESTFDPLSVCPSDRYGAIVTRYPRQFIECAPDRPAYIDTDFMSFTMRTVSKRVEQCKVSVDVVKPRSRKRLAGPWNVRLTRHAQTHRFETRGWERGEYWIRIRVWKDGRPVGPYVIRKVWKEILPSESKQALTITNQPRLLADAADFDEVSNIRFVSDPLIKPATPVVEMTKPWESELMFFKSLHFDRKSSEFRLEYTVEMGAKEREQEFARLPATTALVTSSDGVKWTKPNLGLVEYRGSKQNNLIPDHQVRADRIVSTNAPTLAHDLDKATFRFYDADRDGPVDMRNFFVGAVKRSFIGKCKNRPEFYRGGSYPLEKRGNLYLVLTREPILFLGVGMDLYHTTESIRLHVEDKSTGTYYYFFRPGAPCYPSHDAVYDNMHMTRRCLGVMWTRDGINWQRRLTVVPDERDVAATELYALSLFNEAHGAVSGRPALALERHKYNVAIEGNRTYLGAIAIYDSKAGQQSPEAVRVNDLLHWKRFSNRREMIPNGPPGSADFGMVKIRSWYYEFNNEWWFPYSAINGLKQLYPGLGRCDSVDQLRKLYPQYAEMPGFQNWDQFWKLCKTMRYYPAIARCRKGRVAHAEPIGKCGSLTTRPFKLDGKELVINAATQDGGSVCVAVLNNNGSCVAGFEQENCNLLRTDSLHVKVRWKQASLHQLMGKTVRLKFHLDRARLYTYHIE